MSEVTIKHEVSTDVTVSVYCTCGEKLDDTTTVDTWGDIAVDVEPCANCLESMTS